MEHLLFDISSGIIVGKRIGYGGYSDVYKGVPCLGGPGHGICNNLAIKVIRRHAKNSQNMEDVRGQVMHSTQPVLTLC